MTPDDIRAMGAYLAERRPADAQPLDIIMEGETPGDDAEAARAIIQRWSEAGATWWLESRWSVPHIDVALERIRQGPPRHD